MLRDSDKEEPQLLPNESVQDLGRLSTSTYVFACYLACIMGATSGNITWQHNLLLSHTAVTLLLLGMGGGGPEDVASDYVH